MHLTRSATRAGALVVALTAIPGAAVAQAAASPPKVTDRSAVTTLNDASAAEQAFIFRGLAKGKDLRYWQTGRALRATLEASRGPGGRRLRVSLAPPPLSHAGAAGVVYIGHSTRRQLLLATYTTSHHVLEIIVKHPPTLS